MPSKVATIKNESTGKTYKLYVPYVQKLTDGGYVMLGNGFNTASIPFDRSATMKFNGYTLEMGTATQYPNGFFFNAKYSTCSLGAVQGIPYDFSTKLGYSVYQETGLFPAPMVGANFIYDVDTGYVSYGRMKMVITDIFSVSGEGASDCFNFYLENMKQGESTKDFEKFPGNLAHMTSGKYTKGILELKTYLAPPLSNAYVTNFFKNLPTENYPEDTDGDDDSDPVPPDPDFPISVAQTGFVTMYAPTLQQLKQLASFMWSQDFLDVLLKLQQNPYEAILSIKTVKCEVATSGADHIILGNVDTQITSAEIINQYQQIDCGSIQIDRYYGNFLDYNPYTSVKIYLPFIGYRELDVDEVMNSNLHLYYNVDLLTGSCVAVIQVTKSIDGTNLNSVLYQFDGICANEVPVTASDFTQILSAIIRGAATTASAVGITAATGGTGAGASGALLGSATAGEASTMLGTTMVVNSAIDTVTTKVNVQHGGSLSGSMGGLATKQPYVIITRVVAKNPKNYAKLHGVPSNTYKTLSSLKGFTQIQDIQISSTIGSVDETEEIKQLLLGGVVI